MALTALSIRVESSIEVDDALYSPSTIEPRAGDADEKLLGVDGAAVSLMHDGMTDGTFGCSGELSRRLDELQFTYGEGPCLDAVTSGRPVLVSDLREPGSSGGRCSAGRCWMRGSGRCSRCRS